jgi:hypothetical protein
MFMTPREITEQYQPLDGDREDRRWDDNRGGQTDNPWGEFTARPRNTQGGTNTPRRFNRDGGMRPLNTEEHKGRPYFYHSGTESDQDVWDRKLYESQMTTSEYNDARGLDESTGSKDYFNNTGSLAARASYPKSEDYTGTNYDDLYDDRDEYKGIKQAEYNFNKENSSTLYDSIREEGVQFPVHLGSQFGSSGKPEVVGGHHRVAAALDIAPDQPIPVLHHNDLSDARSDSNRKAGFGYR